MLLKKLQLYNFRQFKGDNVLEFSTDETANVTAVLGKNTSGKTTLLQAFYWVLYGETGFETKDFLLNKEAAEDLHPTESSIVRVTVELIHDNTLYTIAREQKYICRDTSQVSPLPAKLSVQYKLQDGQTEFIKDSEQKDAINLILPRDLSKYFFFDGERIQRLGANEKEGRQDLSRAVRGVLGLNVIESAINHLSGGWKNSVVGKLRNSIDTKGNQKLAAMNKEQEAKVEELETIKKQIEAHNTSKNYFDNEIKRVEQIIRENKETAATQSKIDSNEARISTLEQKKRGEAEGIYSFVSKNLHLYFMQPVISQAIGLLKETGDFDKGIPEMHSRAIDFLMERGQCICGTSIEKGTDTYEFLLQERSLLPPQSIAATVRHFAAESQGYINNATSFHDDFCELYSRFRETKREISELITENEKLRDKIQDDLDVGKLESDARDMRKKTAYHQEQIQDLRVAESVKQKEIDTLQESIDNLAGTSEKNRYISTCIDYVNVINNELSEFYREQEKDVRKRLQENVNAIFSKMYHGERKILIDSKYYVSLYPDTDASSGLETVTSFAFIAGIVSLAREKINGDISVNTEPYPLVMDAPFSNADEEHIARVSNILPDVAEQVIIFSMHKDWKHAEKDLGERLSRKYELEKVHETLTIIKEE